MEIYVFNKHFEMQGIIDTYISLIWNREYYKTGTFEFHLNLPNNDGEAVDLIYLLRKDNVLVKEDSPVEAAYIHTIELSDNDKETLVVKGFFIDNFISERFIWDEVTKQGTIEEVMKHFVKVNCINPIKQNRIIPHLDVSVNRLISKPANEQNIYGNLREKIEELALKYDIGWRILFDLTNKKYLFDIYEGNDLSINQSINQRAIFSFEYENVLEQSYIDSDVDLKNMAMVAGQGEGAARKKVLINDNLTGFDRREIFIDASSLSNVREDQTTMTDAEYESLLIEHGNTKLSETQTIKTFESGIILNSNLKYKEDFDLGDIVTIVNERWGLVLNTRITSVTEVYENDSKDVRINFGSNIPTLLEKIMQKMR